MKIKSLCTKKDLRNELKTFFFTILIVANRKYTFFEGGRTILIRGRKLQLKKNLCFFEAFRF